MGLKPVCNFCGVPHWRFVKCDEAASRNMQEEANRRRRAITVIYRSDTDTAWGEDVLHGFSRTGTGTFWKDKDDGPEAS